MSKSKKRVEVFQAIVKSTEDSITLENLITLCNKHQFANEFKDYELKILSIEDNAIIGLITTGHKKHARHILR